MKRYRIELLACITLLSSCAIGPNYTRPVMPLPKTYTAHPEKTTRAATQTAFGNKQHFETDTSLSAQWWELFHSKPLNDLVLASFRHNPNIDEAKAALMGALENVYAQRGALYPFLGLSFAPTRQQTATILTSVLSSNKYNYSLYTGQVFVSYTPDVFGGTRRQLESLVATAKIQHLQLQATYITLATNVVNAAIQEAALREDLLATTQIINSQKRIVALVKEQIKLGDASRADLALQEASLAALAASKPLFEKQLALQRNLLNALTGRFPDDKQTPSFHLNDLKLPGKLPISVPSTLIEHRPDILAAEEQMRAANALIGVAMANRLPNVTIGFTNAGTATTSLGSLFQSNTNFWALAGLISQPIFDGGTLKHKQGYAIALYQQAAAQYRSTIINAFQNVADTLQALRSDAQALQLAHNAELAAQTSLNIARRQLKGGDINISTLLQSEQAYQQAKLTLIQAQANRLSDTVALFQALGGGWWKECKT